MKIPNIWLWSDLHLGHANILKFRKDDGTRLRSEFQSLHDMFGVMCERYHERVKPGDEVYFLGDIALSPLGRRQMLAISTWPGQKRLVRGNHDLFNDKDYHDAGFQSIYGVRQINGVWLTHVPMHPGSLSGRACGNVHGHLHAATVKVPGMHYEAAEDGRYFNVSVERIGYAPIHLEEILAITKWDTKGMIE